MMREILLEHARRYPKMQIEDAVKLLYQSEFGGGHMIADPQRSLAFIKSEWESCREAGVYAECRAEGSSERMAEEAAERKPVEPWTARRQLGCDEMRLDRQHLEPIGGGMYRLYLSALDDGLAPETLNQMFVQTADRKVGTLESFEQNLGVLLECCRSGELPLGEEQVQKYLEEYRQKGYPAVSHSAVYREHYRPAYRVVGDYFIRYYEAFLRIDREMAAEAAVPDDREECSDPEQTGTQAVQQPVLIAIDGMCAGGKSTMGRILQSIYQCRLFHMDDYFLQPFQRTTERMCEVGGNVDYERFREEILDHIGDRDGLKYRIYNCGTRKLEDWTYAPWHRLNLIEGSYSQHPYFGDIWNLRFFCEIGAEEQLHRIRLRNGPDMLERFKQEWIPRENDYFQAFGIREKSILV